jgi:hypothetical protein
LRVIIVQVFSEETLSESHWSERSRRSSLPSRLLAGQKRRLRNDSLLGGLSRDSLAGASFLAGFLSAPGFQIKIVITKKDGTIVAAIFTTQEHTP